MIPNDHLMIWTEVYTGIPGRPRTKCIDYGWCAFPKRTSERYALTLATEILRKKYPANEKHLPLIFVYPIDRTRGFKASDRILGIFA